MRITPLIYIVILITFLANMLGVQPLTQAQEFRLPAPGVMVGLSPDFNPPILKGIKVHPENPFQFEFILDQGDQYDKTEASKLIKYFLAGLTIPEKDLWVNLSPYEKDRIIPNSFGLTEMGRDLLAEDYMLKQITASLIYPEGEVGKKFWKRIYEEAAKKYGTTTIPVNTFNKVWIIPEKAVVYENTKAGTAYVTEGKLKVMLEEDYLSMSRHHNDNVNALGSQIIREVVIPQLTREVNENKNFTQLRQVYNSLILASWYKKKIKDSILAQVYDDKNKLAGIGYKSTVNPEAIYQRYLQAFKKGVFNYIKEAPVLPSPAGESQGGGTAARKYFSGGENLTELYLDRAMIIKEMVKGQALPQAEESGHDLLTLKVNLVLPRQSSGIASASIGSPFMVAKRDRINDKAMNSLEGRLIYSGGSLYIDNIMNDALRPLGGGRLNYVFRYGNSVIRMSQTPISKEILDESVQNMTQVAKRKMGPAVISAGLLKSGHGYIQVEGIDEGAKVLSKSSPDFFDLLSRMLESRLIMIDFKLGNFMQGWLGDKVGVFVGDGENVQLRLNSTPKALAEECKGIVARYLNKANLKDRGGWTPENSREVIRFLDAFIADHAMRSKENPSAQPDIESLWHDLSNTKGLVRENAINFLMKMGAPMMRRNALRYYYLTKFIAEKIEGVPLRLELDDFLQEAAQIETVFLNQKPGSNFTSFKVAIYRVVESGCIKVMARSLGLSFNNAELLTKQIDAIVSHPEKVSSNTLWLPDDMFLSLAGIGVRVDAETPQGAEKELTSARHAPYYLAGLFETLMRIVETLDDQEQQVLLMHYGFTYDQVIYAKEIGDEIQLSERRVRQIRDEALKKLRHPARLRQIKEMMEDIGIDPSAVKLSLRSQDVELFMSVHERHSPQELALKARLSDENDHEGRVDLSPQDEIRLLKKVQVVADFAKRDQVLLPYVLQGFSAQEIAGKIKGFGLKEIEDRQQFVAKQLRFLFTFGVLQEFGSKPQVREQLIRLTSKDLAMSSDEPGAVKAQKEPYIDILKRINPSAPFMNRTSTNITQSFRYVDAYKILMDFLRLHGKNQPGVPLRALVLGPGAESLPGISPQAVELEAVLSASTADPIEIVYADQNKYVADAVSNLDRYLVQYKTAYPNSTGLSLADYKKPEYKTLAKIVAPFLTDEKTKKPVAWKELFSSQGEKFRYFGLDTRKLRERIKADVFLEAFQDINYGAYPQVQMDIVMETAALSYGLMRLDSFEKRLDLLYRVINTAKRNGQGMCLFTRDTLAFLFAGRDIPFKSEQMKIVQEKLAEKGLDVDINEMYGAFVTITNIRDRAKRDQAMIRRERLGEIAAVLSRPAAYPKEHIEAFKELEKMGAEAYAVILKEHIGAGRLQWWSFDALSSSVDAGKYFDLLTAWNRSTGKYFYTDRLIMLASDSATVRVLVEEFNKNNFNLIARKKMLRALDKRNSENAADQAKILSVNTVRVMRSGGLHWRTAADLIKLLNRYPDCEVVFETDTKQAAPYRGHYSILRMVSLAVSEGHVVEFRVKGSREAEVRSLTKEIKDYLSTHKVFDKAMTVKEGQAEIIKGLNSSVPGSGDLYEHAVKNSDKINLGYEDLRPMILAAMDRRMDVELLAVALHEAGVITGSMAEQMPVFFKIEQLTNSDLEFGLLGGSVLNKNNEAFYHALLELFEGVEDGERLAGTLVRMKEGNIRLLEMTGVLKPAEADVFAAKSVRGLEQITDSHEDLKLRLGNVVKSYKPLTNLVRQRMLKRLIPYQWLELLSNYYGLNVSNLIKIVAKDKNVFLWLLRAKAKVDEIKNRVGGSNNAWLIVVGHSLDSVDDWVARAEKKVEAIKDKVGGSSYAWFIVRGQGIENVDAWMVLSEKKVEEIKDKVGGVSNAWQIIIGQGLENIDAWIARAEKKVEQMKDKVGGSSNAWSIIKSQGLDRADAWVTRAQKKVEEIKGRVGGNGNAWIIVRGFGVESTDVWVAQAEKKVEKIEDKVGGRRNAWDMIINQGLEGVDRWIAQAEKKVEEIKDVVGGRGIAWMILRNQGIKKWDLWVPEAEKKVEEIRARVGGHAKAWRIVISQGLEHTDAWVLQAEKKVGEIQEKVGGNSNAWGIVIKQGLDNIDGWVALAEKKVEEIQGLAGAPSIAWYIVVGHGFENLDRWIVPAKNKVEEIKERTGGSTNAWRIVMNQGPAKTDAWVERAIKKVDEIKDRVGGGGNAWGIVIKQGLEDTDDWVIRAEKIVEQIKDSSGGRSGAWRKLLGEGLENDDAMLVEQQNEGGIDLTRASMDVQTQNSGSGIMFHIDPAMLAQLKYASGFVPVIISVSPLKDLNVFLGIA